MKSYEGVLINEEHTFESLSGDVTMRFQYLKPTSVKEAISILDKLQGKAKIIAGGTDLILQMKNDKITPECVVDITGISSLDYIDYSEENGLRIGALTSIRALETSSVLHQRYPVIAQAANQLGSVAIRNMATVGGNLCNAAPSAETAPAFIGQSAKARIIGPNSERVVPLEDFFTGPGTTVLANGELLVEIQVPVPSPDTKGIYLKHALRGTIDLAIVGVAAVITVTPEDKICQDIKLVLGASAPIPMRARNAEKRLKGKKVDDNLIIESSQAASAESRPISDVRASAEYRRKIIEVLTRRALKQLLDQTSGDY
ncbi:FAD binding domain-containing protein [Chloroflexota bacterium]